VGSFARNGKSWFEADAKDFQRYDPSRQTGGVRVDAGLTWGDDANPSKWTYRKHSAQLNYREELKKEPLMTSRRAKF